MLHYVIYTLLVLCLLSLVMQPGFKDLVIWGHGHQSAFRAAGLLLHLSLLLLLLLLLLSLGVKHCSASYLRVCNCYAVTRC